jgi:hypothetical protein
LEHCLSVAITGIFVCVCVRRLWQLPLCISVRQHSAVPVLQTLKKYQVEEEEEEEEEETSRKECTREEGRTRWSKPSLSNPADRRITTTSQVVNRPTGRPCASYQHTHTHIVFVRCINIFTHALPAPFLDLITQRLWWPFFLYIFHLFLLHSIARTHTHTLARTSRPAANLLSTERTVLLPELLAP